MADVAIRADENLDPDVGEDPAQVNTRRNVLVFEATGSFTADREAVERFAGMPEGDTFRRGRRDRTDETGNDAGQRPAAASPQQRGVVARNRARLGGRRDVSRSRRLRRAQPHRPTGGGSLGRGGGSRLGVRVSGCPLADIGHFLGYERSGRPAGHGAAFPSRLQWRAAAGCHRSGVASRDSSISSRSARC